MSAAEVEQEGKKVSEREDDSDDDILKECRDRYRACTSSDSDNYQNALDDLRFLSGGLNQWEPAAAQTRTAQNRPCLTVNNLPTFLHQVTNEQRQNKPAIKVHPVNDEADEETAEVIQGLIRHIEYDSNADVCMDTAVNSAASVGFGWFRFVTDYENERSDDQKIMFKRIRNALSVHIDPLSQEVDGSDMKYCFIDSLEDRKEFERQYPKAEANNSNLIGQDIYRGWFTENTVLVCEYYRIKSVEAELWKLSDGTNAFADDELSPGVTKVKKLRTSTRSIVQWFKCTGADVLERAEIKCDWIPVFPVYGDEIDIQGKVVRSGIIRNSKDSFKMYNLWMTLATEEVTTRPKTPFIGAIGQFKTAKQQWQNANTVPYAYIEYDPVTVDGQIAPPPQRQPMADIPNGMLSMMMHAADNKKATTGLYDSSLGARGNATSGIQEREQQHQGDVANFHYTDNLNITVRHAGRCLLSMLPHYYDGARVIRMMGEDETAEPVQINQPFERTNPKTQTPETVMFDLTKGQYDLTVTPGPSYSTKRQEAAEFMTNAMQSAKDPVTASVVTYLAFKNSDVPGAEEAVKMLKKTLPQGIAEPDEGQEPMIDTPQGPMPASQVGQLIQQMGTALQNAHNEIEQVKAADVEAKRADAANKARELEIKQFEADTKRGDEQLKAQEAADKARAESLKAQADLVKAEADLVSAQADADRARAEAAAVVPAEVEAKNQLRPTMDELAAFIDASRPKIPSTMAITAPSGQTYTVAMQ